MTIDTGDTVKHGPTGETWVVAYVQGDRLAWCGWPEGEEVPGTAGEDKLWPRIVCNTWIRRDQER